MTAGTVSSETILNTSAVQPAVNKRPDSFYALALSPDWSLKRYSNKKKFYLFNFYKNLRSNPQRIQLELEKSRQLCISPLPQLWTVRFLPACDVCHQQATDCLMKAGASEQTFKEGRFGPELLWALSLVLWVPWLFYRKRCLKFDQSPLTVKWFPPALCIESPSFCAGRVYTWELEATACNTAYMPICEFPKTLTE